jgi:hypothetical protein
VGALTRRRTGRSARGNFEASLRRSLTLFVRQIGTLTKEDEDA